MDCILGHQVKLNLYRTLHRNIIDFFMWSARNIYVDATIKNKRRVSPIASQKSGQNIHHTPLLRNLRRRP